MTHVSAIILTKDEEKHIRRCISSLQGVAGRILVVDSFSRDRTVALSRKLGAEVVQRSWRNYADQFQWAIDQLGSSEPWIMRMDADEYLDPELQRELPVLLEGLNDEVAGVYLKRKVLFEGKWIRRGGFYPHILMRIWRSGRGRIEQRWMDEHIVLEPGSKTVTAKGHLVDDNQKGITFWIDKHNRYASREALDLLNQDYGLFEVDRSLAMNNDPQARQKRWIKDNIYSRLPLGTRAAAYFVYRYLFRLGFLDGTAGFIWHFMQAFWYRMLVDVKIHEIETRSRGDPEEIKRILRVEHGLDI